MKNQIPVSAQQPPPRGIIRHSKGVAITIVGLPMADHFFQATTFRIKKVGSNLVLLFAAQSAFAEEDDAEYRLAVEIVFPLEMAAKYLFDLNWKQKSAASDDSFAAVVEKAVQKEWNSYKPLKIYKTPKGSNFRSFPANFAIMALSTGQGAIEFFEAPPGMVVEAIHQKTGWRPNSDVRPILTVVLPPVELYRLLKESEEILKDIPTTPDNEKEDDV